MSKPSFTKMQQAAIDITNKNILVSAAAGSGKTAVLVERIINRILDSENPVDIDRMLVMTFTRAAAQQMKERILNAINEKRSENPYDKNLNKQYALVHNAYIMTIDSFCMNVVRNHFEEIDLSPDFRMADEGEITLLKKDVLDEVIEESYQNGTAEFLEMTEVFASKKTDSLIEELVLSLHRYAESYPDPLEWLGMCAGDKGVELSDNELEAKYPWLSIYVNQIKRELTYLRNILDDAGDVCNMEYGPKPYLASIEADIAFVDSMMRFDSYKELYDKCLENADYAFEKLARVTMPKGEVSAEEIAERTRLKDMVSDVRDKYKKSVNEILSVVSSMSPDTISIGARMMQKPTAELVNLTILFSERFSQRKREKNIVDFGDIEHMCLDILKNGKDTTAREYRDYCEEIYVDEYQDSNFVQEEIVNFISRKDQDMGNVFMVGDVKQSIYGFRNAKPQLFIDKYNTFHVYEETKETIEEINTSITEADHQQKLFRDIRIDLSHNFRSRIEVLSSVNSVFTKIMKSELGGIQYDEAASLHKGREFVKTEYDYTSELNLFVSDADIPNKEAEALMIASRIKELMKNGKVEDSNTESGFRSVRYSDIVILLRSPKGYDNIFKQILESQGIPIFVTATTGYFETLEVRTLLNFLKIIDNPLQDIPLAAVLMSIIGNFTEEEVASIRGEFKEGSLYNALCDYYEKHTECESEILKKIESFIELLSYYRRKSQYETVTDILTEIIDGNYGKLIKAMPAGQKKYANLNTLLKKSIEFGNTSYKGIFQFNRYIEAIRKYDIDYGEANLLDETDDTVRIMSIHKSKGLEFPICFLSGMNKKFNFMDTKEPVLTDGEYGIATDIIDIKRRVKAKSLFKISIAEKKKAELIAEEQRLLYVAMTRAKEKLIMTGVIKDEERFADSFVPIEKAGSYLDMYLCASDHGKVDNINLSFVHAEDLVNDTVEEELDSNISRERLLSVINTDKAADTDRAKVIKKRIEYVYPHEDRGYVKLSVSELKHRSDSMADDEAKFDADVSHNYLDDSEEEQNASSQQKENNGADHGSAVHRIFEIWDYSRPSTKESVEQFLNMVREEMLMEEDLCDLVGIEEVHDFLNSEIALRMKNAFERGELYREQPFVICDDENDPESMLIQGIIDAYFYEDGKIVLVDYKTDKVSSEKTLINRHKVQLEYYAKALGRLLHREIKESVIYSTVLKKSISI